jgi:two-component system response regulator CpxR
VQLTENDEDRSTIARLLAIDDDVKLCESLRTYLELEHFQFECSHRGEEGLSRALSDGFDLVILGAKLPGISGFEVLRQLRFGSRVPVLVLTAQGDEVDRIVGLEIGADDCLSKPFNPRELVARIHAILRRSRYEAGESRSKRYPSVLSVGDVRMDSGTRTVYKSGSPVALTAVEFDLLERMLHSAGSVLSREELAAQVLDRELSPLDRSIDNHISQLRKKLGAHCEGIERIKTIRGVGYLYSNSEANANS